MQSEATQAAAGRLGFAATASARPAMSQDLPLAGLKVIDCASFIAAPVATTVLADFGADVIRIEPPGGEPYRPDDPATRVPYSEPPTTTSLTTARSAPSPWT